MLSQAFQLPRLFSGGAIDARNVRAARMHSRFVAFARCLVATFAVALACIPVHAQFYKIHNADVAVGGTGQFTTSLTSQRYLPHQATTDSAGFLLSFREHPVSWAGIELNYQYSAFSERFVNTQSVPLANVPVAFHEGTGAYLIHTHFRHFQPLIGVGGGVLLFGPSGNYTDQLRGTGLFEIGFDIPTSNPHVGFRVQGRSLLYRAPNFDNAGLSSSRWVSTNQPSASVYYRF